MTTDKDKFFDEQTLKLGKNSIKMLGVSQKGRKRKNNQDRFVAQQVSDSVMAASVADGMGGEAHGDYAAQIAVSVFSEIPSVTPGREKKLMTDLFAEADQAILDMAGKNSEFYGMGTTLTAVLINENKAYWAHVGDSRLYLFQGGKLTQMTTDHTFAQFLLDEGEITSQQLASHYAAHILEQCVGRGECVPQTGSLHLKPDDLLLLTTDGLHNVLGNKKIETILNMSSDIREKKNKLVSDTVNANGTDDITILTLFFL